MSSTTLSETNGIRPIRCAMNSSWSTLVFDSICTQSIAIVGTWIRDVRNVQVTVQPIAKIRLQSSLGTPYRHRLQQNFLVPQVWAPRTGDRLFSYLLRVKLEIAEYSLTAFRASKPFFRSKIIMVIIQTRTTVDIPRTGRDGGRGATVERFGQKRSAGSLATLIGLRELTGLSFLNVAISLSSHAPRGR